MTSHDLLRKWSRERDELAFRELVHRHAPMVFATSKRILRDDTEAQDVTQECFETLATTRRLPDSNLGPWLHRVATNRCLDRLRTTGRRAKREIDFATRQLQPHTTGWNDIYDLVDEAIAELPDKYRTVIIAHFLEGRPQADIANELHLTRQAVHERLNRGIEAVRASLKRRGVEISAATFTALLVQHASSATISATLTVSLGKLALGTHALPASGAIASTFAGISIGKLLIGGIAALLIVAAGLLWVRNDSTAHAPETRIANSATARMASTSNATPEEASPQDSPSQSLPTPVPSARRQVPEKAASAEPDPPPASVAGTVIRADGKALAKAMVWFCEPAGNLHSTEADAAGKFHIETLGAGEYTVCVTPPGVDFTPHARVATMTLEPNEQRRDVQLTYGTGSLSIRGKVTDAAGKPIKSIAVATIDVKAAYSAACTDAQGRYALEFLPEGEYRIDTRNTPDAPDRFTSGWVTAKAGDKNVDFVLKRTIILEGRVLRADTRAPIPHFRVSFMNSHYREFEEILMHNGSDVSDEQGRFRLEGASPGAVTVAAMAEGFSPTFIHTNGTDGTTVSNLEVLMSPSHQLTGSVLDANGQPIPNAKIYNNQVTMRSYRATVSATTDATGTFTIADAPPARSFLSAYHDDYAPAAVRIGAGPANIVLQRPASLKVTATSAENMLLDARVMIFYGPHANADYIDGMRFDQSGTATKTDLIPGPIRVRIHRRNDSEKFYVERDIVLQPSAESAIKVDFAPIAASLNGIVTWRGVPANATLLLSIQTLTGTELYETTTLSDGSYSLSDLPAGEASVRVDIGHDQGLPISNIIKNLYLAPDKLNTVDFNLLGAGTVTGHVARVALPDRMAIIVFEGTFTLEELTDRDSLGPYGRFNLVRRWAADEQGNYSITDLEPGEYTIYAALLREGDWMTQQPFAVQHVRVKANETAVADFAYR